MNNLGDYNKYWAIAWQADSECLTEHITSVYILSTIICVIKL